MVERSRARALGALLAITLVVLSGCSDDPAKPKPLKSSSASPSSASPSPSAPTLPPEAKGTSAASAEAFVRHYVDLNIYAMQRAIAELRDALDAGLLTCRTCIAGISNVYQVDGRIEGGRLDGWIRQRQPSRFEAADTSQMRDSRSRRQTSCIKPATPVLSMLRRTSGHIRIFTLRQSPDDWIVDATGCQRDEDALRPLVALALVLMLVTSTAMAAGPHAECQVGQSAAISSGLAQPRASRRLRSTAIQSGIWTSTAQHPPHARRSSRSVGTWPGPARTPPAAAVVPRSPARRPTPPRRRRRLR